MPVKAIVLSTVLLCCLALLSAVEWKTYTNEKYSYRVSCIADWPVRSDAVTGWFEASWQLASFKEQGVSQVAPKPPVNTLPDIFSVQVDSLGEDARNLDTPFFMQDNLAILNKQLTAKGCRNIKVLSSVKDTLLGTVAHRIEIRCTQQSNLTNRMTILKIRHKEYLYTLTCSAMEGMNFDNAASEFETMLGSFGFLTHSSSYLDDYIRVRADLSGAETVYHWKGKVYSIIPGEKRRELFNIEGYNILKAVPKDDGYWLLGREAAFFLDYRSDQMLTTWRNPFTGKDVTVLHVFNDPVNQDLGFTEENLQLLPMYLPSSELADDIVYNTELFPFYPNPLSRKEFPLNSQSDTYQATELSQYIVAKSALANSKASSVPAVYTFTKILPWLPFMEMGDRQGSLLIVCRGEKLAEGFKALPENMGSYVLLNKPEFAHAPEIYSQPNETIWTSFKKQAALLQPVEGDDD